MTNEGGNGRAPAERSRRGLRSRKMRRRGEEKERKSKLGCIRREGKYKSLSGMEGQEGMA